MNTDKSWIGHNVAERFDNPNVDFRGWLNPVPFQKMSFSDASTYTAKLIVDRYPKLFLGLSGGIDSEFMICRFNELKIQFETVIVKTPYNHLELEYAFHLCKNLQITPKILDVSRELFWGVFESLICSKLNGDGPGSVSSVIISHYASLKNGVAVIGDHMLDTDHTSLLSGAGMAEWDFYPSVLYPENSISFMYYTPELTYSMISEINGVETHSEYKHRIYNRPFRPKISYQYNDYYINHKPIVRECRIGSRDEVLTTMDKWNDS